jgi:(hydroxyamino)benzene mutase
MFPDRGILRAGFVLLILAMLTGLAIPVATNHRLALASHLTGLLGALILMVIAVAWPALSHRPLPAKIIRYCFISSAYANWIASALGSIWGTRRFTPLSGGGFSAAAWQEALVAFLQVAQAAVVLIGSALVVYELGPARGVSGERAADEIRT